MQKNCSLCLLGQHQSDNRSFARSSPQLAHNERNIYDEEKGKAREMADESGAELEKQGSSHIFALVFISGVKGDAKGNNGTMRSTFFSLLFHFRIPLQELSECEREGVSERRNLDLRSAKFLSYFLNNWHYRRS